MAMTCPKCGGIIPDLVISPNGVNQIDRNDCKNHYKPGTLPKRPDIYG